jgi:aspartyl-tRNA(Asn)/glutamyl-tRNA(Gln) amidotransferase subunit A
MEYEKSVMLEDSIMVKGGLTTAGSALLSNFTAPFDATVAERLREKNIPVGGKAGMAEFGIPNLPEENTAAVKAVANGTASCCLCNDLFGTYRRNAAESGVCYIHPTYGTVSRYGLIPLAASMDQIGVVCRDIRDGFLILSAIAGNDEKDGAMFPEKKYCYKKNEHTPTVCVPPSVFGKAGDATREAIVKALQGFPQTDDEPGYAEAYEQTAYILRCAEISHNISRYDGIKYGYRAAGARNVNEVYTKTRAAFGLETKLTAIFGAYVLSGEQYAKYYEKAMKVRRLIKKSLRFDNYDIIALPASSSALTALAGLPSITFSLNGHGIQLVAGVKNENALLTAWEGVAS